LRTLPYCQRRLFGWLILLLGSSIAFYHQHPEYLVLCAGKPRLSNWMRACGLLMQTGEEPSLSPDSLPALADIEPIF
jgi:hypothetical protein